MADKFIDHILTAPARIVTLHNTVGENTTVFIDPVVIAEVILKERELVEK